MKAHRKIAEGTALIEVIQRAAELVGHELRAEYRDDVVEGRALRWPCCADAATPPSTTRPA